MPCVQGLHQPQGCLEGTAWCSPLPCLGCPQQSSVCQRTRQVLTDTHYALLLSSTGFTICFHVAITSHTSHIQGCLFVARLSPHHINRTLTTHTVPLCVHKALLGLECMCCCRTNPDVVVQRQELLHTCMQDLMALNPQGPTLTPLLAFLDPAHITCPIDSTTPISTSRQQPEPMGSQLAVPGSIGVGFSNHGRRVRLLTELPVRFTDRELMLRQQGQCAECGQGLPAVGISWLGRTSSKVGCMGACSEGLQQQSCLVGFRHSQCCLPSLQHQCLHDMLVRMF